MNFITCCQCQVTNFNVISMRLSRIALFQLTLQFFLQSCQLNNSKFEKFLEQKQFLQKTQTKISNLNN